MTRPGDAPRNDGADERTPRPAWVRPVKILVGILLLPLGIVGLFLPFLQGVVFLLIAVALLSSELPFLRRWKERLQKRHPGLSRRAERARQSLLRWLRDLRSRWRGKERERDDRS